VRDGPEEEQEEELSSVPVPGGDGLAEHPLSTIINAAERMEWVGVM
jgi:hypothetical protein